ncbi:hypothetical protein TG1_43 [Streptomyces phage TG1]|uniref:Uncharacterized protein n=1 Tax=Streptomyces phage TG1 TaxID=2927987 RepID=K4HZ61_9CAUD|nr:hypothetical protein D281_gp43 [Streptomyces phage TG1]AFU62238.1 hypothetical protein TG1_43 [Streptomyces phage TG1]
MHSVPYFLDLTVWVPSGTFNEWTPCPAIGEGVVSSELITSCAELPYVLRAQSSNIARMLSAPGLRVYSGFRVLGRRSGTDLLIAAVEWQRSKETGGLVAYPEWWTSCEYVHPRLL